MHYKVEFGGHYSKKQKEKDIHNCAVSITFFAKNIDSLPKFKRVGEVVRIHRANVGQYKNHKTFLVNIEYGSSWAIFKGASENEVDEKIVPQNEGSISNIQSYFGHEEPI